MTKSYSLDEINAIIGGILNKVEDIKIEKLSPPLLADDSTLALALSEEEIHNLQMSDAKAALVPFGAGLEHITTIEVERPRLAMMKLLHLFYTPPQTHHGIHASAVVDPTAVIEEGVSIGPNVVVCRNVKIAKGTKLVANVYVGQGAQIGCNCLFHPGVNIGDAVKIGNNVIINQGASVGADGFSFVTETQSTVEAAKEQGSTDGDFSTQKIYKIPSIGSVEIKDDVEIGANATIDRGTVENTIIGKGTKIDNLVMIAHNCKVGENCMIISQVGVAGSCNIGDRVVLAGQVGMADHVNIGADSIVMAQSGVSKSIPAKSIVFGSPAMPRKEYIKQMKTLKDAEFLIKEFKKYKPLLDQFVESQE
ncbi:MAG: UDP-3-O-(3-hydroxymyristoyl)glucosamine N-acyltransferase [Candidatus Gastranaerophilales bacterium]|nr:UDP-3-O-(3-hydroxymyristoyl)glucosamine N-acyltransferase [Candidatus Gastranaerophilales bacterium]